MVQIYKPSKQICCSTS